MTRVGVIEPVVVVGDVIGFIASHAAERGFAGVPEAAVGGGHIFRAGLQVHSAIALHLVSVLPCLSIEQVEVMHPDVAVFRVE